MVDRSPQIKWREPKSKFLSSLQSTDEKKQFGNNELPPRQLVTHCDNLFLVWNQDKGSLLAVDVNNPDDHCRELIPSHKLSFTVERIQSAPGNILLWGSGGLSVVVLPDQIALSQDGPIKCRTLPVAEVLLLQVKGLSVLAAKWVPGSVKRVLILTNDNCLRVFDASSKCTQPVVTVQVLRRSMSLSRMSFTIASVTGGQVIDFDFGRTPDEVFCLSTSGSVYCVTQLQDGKPQVSSPLAMLPDSEDNHGSDGYSILTLHSGTVTMLVVTGTGGTLYHCLVLDRDQDDEAPELFVVEKITLSLTLVESTDGYRCPILLEKDRSVSNRYFCIHGSGVHIVAVPLTELLQKYAQQEGNNDASFVDDNSNAQCLVEQILCTRTTELSPDDPPMGATVVPSYPSPKLLTMTSGAQLIVTPLTRYRISDLQVTEDLLSETPLVSSGALQLTTTAPDYQKEIKLILGGSRVPVLAQADKTVKPEELLELTLKTTQLFRDRYLGQMGAVLKLIDSKSQSLRDSKQDQQKQMDDLNKEFEQVQQRMTNLKEKFDQASKTSNRQMTKLHDIIQCVQRKNPSRANPQMLEEINTLETRTKRLDSLMETTKDRVNDLTDIREAEKLTAHSIENSAGTLNENQELLIRNRLKNHGNDIAKMFQELDNLKAEVS